MKYFVLKPRGRDKYAQASRAAIAVYAQIIEGENSLLAKELRKWIAQEKLDILSKP